VTLEIIALALATTIRPTSLAAVYALLASDVPRRLMGAYVGAGLAELVVYNLIWFAIPIAALAVCFVRPAAARDAVQAIQDWTRRHARTIVVVVAFVVGGVLVLRGVLGL
jgi:hypothetical protein